MHKDDYHRDLNHYDYSETADNYIFNNSVCEYKSVEETVEKKIRNIIPEYWQDIVGIGTRRK